MKVSVLTIIPALLLALGLVGETSPSASPPNIIFLLTDDQDVTAYSLDYMPKLNTIMRKGGMEFVNFFVSTALCCPSRVTLLKGQYCHNHGIWDNGELNNVTFSSGGLKKIIEEKLESETVATLMGEAGYETFLIGKYVNGYSDQFAHHVPLGWDHWLGMTKAAYYGPHFSDDGKLVKTCKDTYQTDYISKHARDMIINRNKNKPFFMYIAPFAPHSPSKPAKRHAHMFSNISAPRFESFNPGDDVQSQKPSWLKTIPKLSAEQVADIDELYRNRLRTLQAVDEMLEDITLLLAHEGIEDDTYLFYMGDNGLHLGDFRLAAGKRQAYDTDIRVPFLVKGPGVTGGTKVTEVAMSIDLMPTWLELANGKNPSSYVPDGLSIVPLLNGHTPREPAENTFRAAALIEMYGGSSNMGLRYEGMEGFHGNKFWNNTFRAVRVINGSGWTSNADWLYAEWCTGEREFYNVARDKRQIHNVIDEVDAGLLQKLTTLTATLGRCTGKDCSGINFVDIAQEAESHSGSVMSHVECHNPPDTGGWGLGISHDVPWPLSSACDAVLEQGDFCKKLVSNGFPFSDEEPVSDRELEVKGQEKVKGRLKGPAQHGSMSAELQKKKYLRRAKQILHKPERKASNAKKLQAPFSCNSGCQDQSGPSLVRYNSDPTSVASPTLGPLVQRVTPTIRNKLFPTGEFFPSAHSSNLSGQSEVKPCVRTSVVVDRDSDQHSTPPPPPPECGATKLLFPSHSDDCVGHMSSTPVPTIRGTRIDHDYFTSENTTTPELNSLSAKLTELECQLKVQTDINKELKRLLVASMGNDLQYRVNQIAKEKATISQDLDASLHQVAENYEEIDRVSIECDIWRSKFLASRLMVDELAGWKAKISMQLRESQRALQCMLKESSEMGEYLLQCNAHLNNVGSHFKLNLRCDDDDHIMDSTVLGLARVNSSRARLLHKQLCSMGEAAGILNRTHCSVQNATAGERLAKQALGNTHQMQTYTGRIGERSMCPSPQILYKEQLAEYSRLSSKGNLSYSTVQQYLLGSGTTNILIHCNRCSGEIHNV